MLKIQRVWVRSFDVQYLTIFWDIVPAYEDTLQYAFVVERSGSQFGPFSSISPELVDIYSFKDTNVIGYHTFYNKLWYRVRVVSRATAEESFYPESGGVKLAADPDLAGLEIALQERLKLTEYKGRKVWIFPKKKFGQVCPVCFDKVTRRRIKSNCPSCFDTTWLGGYDYPVETYAQIITPDEQTILAAIGKIETEQTMCILSNYPEVNVGDIIVEAENIRWRVGGQLRKVCKSRSIVRQEVPINRIQPSDIEYSLPINLTSTEIKNLVATPERNYTNPHNISDLSLDKAMNTIFGRK